MPLVCLVVCVVFNFGASVVPIEKEQNKTNRNVTQVVATYRPVDPGALSPEGATAYAL